MGIALGIEFESAAAVVVVAEFEFALVVVVIELELGGADFAFEVGQAESAPPAFAELAEVVEAAGMQAVEDQPVGHTFE